MATKKLQIIGSAFSDQIEAAIANKIDAPDTSDVGYALVVKTIDENGKPTEWETVDVGTVAADVTYDTTLSISGAAADAKATGEAISELQKEIARMHYQPIDITSFKHNVSNIVEIGSEVDALTFTWSVNKTPTTQDIRIVNPETVVNLGTTDTSYTWDDLGLGQTTTFKLTVTDVGENGSSTDTATTSVTFLNGVYYGVMDDADNVDSETILRLWKEGKLTRKLQSEHNVTFTADVAATERLTYIAPAVYKTPVFTIELLNYEWDDTMIDFTNDSGYTQSYIVWKHGRPGVSPTVKVSKGV